MTGTSAWYPVQSSLAVHSRCVDFSSSLPGTLCAFFSGPVNFPSTPTSQATVRTIFPDSTSLRVTRADHDGLIPSCLKKQQEHVECSVSANGAFPRSELEVVLSTTPSHPPKFGGIKHNTYASHPKSSGLMTWAWRASEGSGTSYPSRVILRMESSDSYRLFGQRHAPTTLSPPFRSPSPLFHDMDPKISPVSI